MQSSSVRTTQMDTFSVDSTEQVTTLAVSEPVDSNVNGLSYNDDLPVEIRSAIYVQGLKDQADPAALVNYLLKISRIDFFHNQLVFSDDTCRFVKEFNCLETLNRLCFESIMHRDLNALKLAIRLGANVNTCRVIANQPIYFLFDESNVSPVFTKALEGVLKNSADKVVVATSLLHLAINQNWINGVKLLLNDEKIIIQQRILQYEINLYSPHPPTLFFSNYLIQPVVNRDLNNATSLMHLAVSINNLALVKLLHKKGFSTQLKSNKETPIMLAAKLGHYEIIHYLKKVNRPNPTACDDILVIAIKNNRYETVKKLIIELGIKPQGFRPLAKARTAAMAKLLIQNGADATVKNPSKNTYLHLAMNACDIHNETSIELIRYLINFHSTIPVNQYECTPLHLICIAPSHRNIITIINILVTHFGNSILEIKNKNGQTALEAACYFENNYALKRLIELNANSDVIPTQSTTSTKENIIYNANNPILEGVAKHLIRTSDNISHLTPADKDLKALIEIKNKNQAFIQALTQQKDILLEKFKGSYITQKKLDAIDDLITQINQDLTLDSHIHIQDWVKNAKENPLVVLAKHRRKEGFLSFFSPLYHTDSIKFLMRFTQDKKFILAQKTINPSLTPTYQF